MLSLDQINDLLSTLIGGPSEKIDPSIIQILSRIADEFVEDLAKGAAQLTNLRNGTSVSVKDVRLYLEEEYGIKLSGYGGDAEEKAVRLKQETRSRVGNRVTPTTSCSSQEDAVLGRTPSQINVSSFICFSHSLRLELST